MNNMAICFCLFLNCIVNKCVLSTLTVVNDICIKFSLLTDHCVGNYKYL